MQPVPLFISYSRQDENWKRLIAKHLGVLQAEGMLEVWDDGRIGTGTEWYVEIKRALASARLAILLISVDFLNSDFIRRVEVVELFNRRLNENLPIFPIIVRPCAWQRSQWLARLEVRPKGGHALSTMGDNAETHLAAIADEIASVLQNLGPRRAGLELPAFAKEAPLGDTVSNPRYRSDLKALTMSGFDPSAVIGTGTVIVVVGSRLDVELLDRPVGEMVRDAIDKKGSPDPFRRGIVVTDVEWQRNVVIQGQPIIAIGGPISNDLTKEIAHKAGSGGNWTIGKLHGAFLRSPSPRVALWGPYAEDTALSAERYIQRPDGLDTFLRGAG